MGTWILILFFALSAVELTAQTERNMGAVRLLDQEEIVLDGILDEPVWQRVPVAGDFLQQEPNEGAPATEATEVRILFDSSHLYIGAICKDSDPTHILTTSLVRDFSLLENDAFEVVFDPFDDNRNGFLFAITPDGAKRDVQITNDGDNTNPTGTGFGVCERTATRKVGPLNWSSLLRRFAFRQTLRGHGESISAGATVGRTRSPFGILSRDAIA